jgi:hypothetical protein
VLSDLRSWKGELEYTNKTSGIIWVATMDYGIGEVWFMNRIAV